MTITITSQGRPALRAIRLVEADAGEVRVIANDTTDVGFLVALDDCHSAIPVEHGHEVVTPLTNCWRLTLLDEQGGITDAHTLFRSASAKNGTELTTQLAAWAALTAVRDSAVVSPKRG